MSVKNKELLKELLKEVKALRSEVENLRSYPKFVWYPYYLYYPYYPNMTTPITCTSDPFQITWNSSDCLNNGDI